jgi:hypothetical protein
MNPCRYCIPPERHIGCHSTCEKRQIWKEANDQRVKIERLERVGWVDTKTFNDRMKGKRHD